MIKKKKFFFSTSIFWFFIIWFIVTFFMWFLAFFPVDNSSELLISLQEVCFGRLENGMPDNYGWIKLIFTPLALLLSLYLVWTEELLYFFNQMLFSLIGRIILIILFLLIIFQFIIVGKKIINSNKIESALSDINFANKDILFSENYPRTMKNAPTFQLINFDGKKFDSKMFLGRITYLTFAFTRCSSICPLLINVVRTALNNSIDKNRQLVIISLDPWRETVNNIKKSIKYMMLNSREYYLVGSIKKIKKILNDYEVPRVRELKNGEIIHPGLVYVIDHNGRIAYTFNNPSSRWLMDAGDRLKNE